MIGIFPFPRVILAYAAWLATITLGAGLFVIWRGALIALYLRMQLDKWAYPAFQNAVVLILALIWLVLAIATEDWYRRSVKAGLLRRRAGRVLVVEAALLAVGYAIYWLA